MAMPGIMTLAVAAAIALWAAAPALAHSKFTNTTKLAETKSDKGTEAKTNAKAAKKSTKIAKKSTKAAKKHTRKAGGDKGTSAALSHSNKGGQDRGLDRADKAAGERGQQGRDNARTKQTR